MRKLTNEEFIQRSNLKHGNKYDYSLVEYNGSGNKVKIICKEHGIFEQIPFNHLQGCDCPKCAYIANGINGRNTLEEFIEKSNKVHNETYDYSLVNYLGNKIKVKIICKFHGIFEQRPDCHISGDGCSRCSGNKKGTNEEFIEKAIKIHKNKYDYSLVDYKNSNVKIKIICSVHGVFEQNPGDHLNDVGCAKCKPNYKLDKNEFVKRSIEIHRKKYDYSKVEYINSHTSVIIVCKEHGEFYQKPHKHILQKQGCPKCKISKGVDKICNLLDDKNIKYEMEKIIDGCISSKGKPLQFDLYIPDMNIYIEYDGEQHFRSVSSWGGERSFIERLERDRLKDKFCIENNINLSRISYMDNIEFKLNEILN